MKPSAGCLKKVKKILFFVAITSLFFLTGDQTQIDATTVFDTTYKLDQSSELGNGDFGSVNIRGLENDLYSGPFGAVNFTGVEFIVTPNYTVLVPPPPGTGNFGIQKFGWNTQNIAFAVNDVVVFNPLTGFVSISTIGWGASVNSNSNINGGGSFVNDVTGTGQNRQDPLHFFLKISDPGAVNVANVYVANLNGHQGIAHIAGFQPQPNTNNETVTSTFAYGGPIIEPSQSQSQTVPELPSGFIAIFAALMSCLILQMRRMFYRP